MPAPRRVKLSPTDRVFNGVVGGLARLGVSLYGTRLLAVRGRKTGAWRTAVVNVLEHDGVRYLVAPRGETDWVRNVRAAKAGELRLGRQREPFRAVEIADAEKPPVLRGYLARWAFAAWGRWCWYPPRPWICMAAGTPPRCDARERA